jgi:hypothetical protein
MKGYAVYKREPHVRPVTAEGGRWTIPDRDGYVCVFTDEARARKLAEKRWPKPPDEEGEE